MLCSLSLPVTEATDGELQCFIGVSVKVSGLGGWVHILMLLFKVCPDIYSPYVCGPLLHV